MELSLISLSPTELPGVIREALRSALAQSTVVLTVRTLGAAVELDPAAGCLVPATDGEQLHRLDDHDTNEELIRLAGFVARALYERRDQRSAILLDTADLVMLHAALDRDAVSTKHLVARAEAASPREAELRTLFADQLELLAALDDQMRVVLAAGGAEQPFTPAASLAPNDEGTAS